MKTTYANPYNGRGDDRHRDTAVGPNGAYHGDSVSS